MKFIPGSVTCLVSLSIVILCGADNSVNEVSDSVEQLLKKRGLPTFVAQFAVVKTTGDVTALYLNGAQKIDPDATTNEIRVGSPFCKYLIFVQDKKDRVLLQMLLPGTLEYNPSKNREISSLDYIGVPQSAVNWKRGSVLIAEITDDGTLELSEPDAIGFLVFGPPLKEPGKK